MQADLTKYQFIQTITELDYVDAVYLYGSRARGDNTKYSDIDLAVVCPQATDADWIDIMEIVENADT